MTISAKHLLAAAAVTSVMAGSAHAASFSIDFQQTVASEEYDAVSTDFGPSTPGRFYHISVNANNAGYASYIALDPSDNSQVLAPYTRTFSDPVVGWSFIGPNGTVNGELGVSEESGGIATWTTTDQTDPITNTFDGFGQNQIKFWNATDPGADFDAPANAADVGTTTHDKNVGGYRSFGQATATVDVSGLTSGTLNVFYGAFSATPMVDAVLRDTDGVAPDIVIADFHLNGAAANRTEIYAAELSFTTDGVYDTIVYNYLQPGDDGKGTGSGNGRAGGIVLTGSSGPPPIPGDTDGDGDIDDSDLGTSFSNYTGPVGAAGGKTAAEGDTDGDGDVDDSDLGTSFSGYTGPLSAAVPEPTSLALLGLGGLLIARRRRA